VVLDLGVAGYSMAPHNCPHIQSNTIIEDDLVFVPWILLKLMNLKTIRKVLHHGQQRLHAFSLPFFHYLLGACFILQCLFMLFTEAYSFYAEYGILKALHWHNSQGTFPDLGQRNNASEIWSASSLSVFLTMSLILMGNHITKSSCNFS